MKIVVCVKRVRVLGDEVEFSDDGRDVDQDLCESALNEWDAHALEEALELRDRNGGTVVAITADTPAGDETLRRCLAMGADRAIRVEPGETELADPITVARALVAPVRGERPDLILTGVQSSDAVQAATPAALAGLLGLPRVAVVTRLDHQPGADGSGVAVVHRELEGGLIDITEVDLPAVLTIQTGINKPRYATLRAIKQAASKELAVVPAEPDGVPAYRVRRVFTPPAAARAEFLAGNTADIARRIAEIIKEELR